MELHYICSHVRRVDVCFAHDCMWRSLGADSPEPVQSSQSGKGATVGVYADSNSAVFGTFCVL